MWVGWSKWLGKRTLEATHWEKDIDEKWNKKDIRRRRQGFFWEQQMIWRNKIGELYSILFSSFSLLSYFQQSIILERFLTGQFRLYIRFYFVLAEGKLYMEPLSHWKREDKEARSFMWMTSKANLLLPIVLRSTGMRKQNWRYHILWLLGWILTYRNSIPIGTWK